MENGDGPREARDQKEDGSRRHSHSHHHHQTPSRRRVNLGAPANYYFKYMNSSSKNDANNSMMTTGDDDNDTGTISIPGLTPAKGDGGGRQSLMDTSYLSIADSSSGSEASDLLNKSTLSDTTELTASNFVLVTTSKQQMVAAAAAAQKSSASDDRATKADRALQILEAMEQPPPEKENQDNFSIPSSAEKKPPAVADAGYNGSVSKETIGLRDSSPSLRSRISASPASLRRYREDLRSSRIQRQKQRDQDAKRRESTDSGASLPLMHAQLEALTTETAFSRQRLPPGSSRHIQLSQEHKGTFSNQSTPVGSTAPSNNESTASIDMNELNALLGITGSERRESSSVSAHRTSIDRALGEETTNLDFSTANGHDGAVAKSPPLPEAIEVSVSATGSRGVDSNGNKETSRGQATPRDHSLSSPPPFKLRPTPGSRSKLTPSKLSGGPKRVVNPQSIFSPAKNTRSAKKLRGQDHDETLDDQDASLLSTHRSTRLSFANSVASSTSEKSDETASPGEIADLFGTRSPQGEFDRIDASALPSPMNDSRDSAVSRDESKSQEEHDFEETASLGDINELFGPRPSTDRDSYGSNAEGLNEETQDVVGASLPGGDMQAASEDDTSNENKTTSPSTSTTETPEQASKSNIGPKESPKNDEPKNQNAFTSPTEDLPSTPPNVDLAAMSPGVKRLLSHSKTSVQEENSMSARKENNGSDLKSMSMKKPMRLVPNAHIAPTPTKLDPTPKRVLNPNNPNSPARNTRSASRSKQSPGKNDSVALESGKKHQRDDLAKPSQLFQEEVVVRASKRRRSSMMTTPSSLLGDKGHPKGILSSRKKPSSIQRSVAFGSPEAAEYHVGSPSVSITPMPRGRAKALYRLPKGHEGQQEEQNQGAGSQTMEIESGLEVLVDKISVEAMNDSPELSPIEKNKSDTGVYNVPRDLSSTNPLESVASKERAERRGEQTVELEGGIDDLLANAAAHASPSEDSTPSGFHAHAQEQSFEMTDAESIASIHSRRSEKFTAEFNVKIGAQKLDFSVATQDSQSLDEDSAMDVDAGETVELEGNLLSMLEANGPSELSANKSPSNEDGSENMVDQTRDQKENATQILTQLTPEHDESEILNLSNASTSPKQQAGLTVELETNMTDLLAGASDDLGQKKGDGASTETGAPLDVDTFGDNEESEMAVANRSSRRKSLAQKSFTLYQPDQLAVSVDDVEHQSLVVNEKSVSFCDTSEFIVSDGPDSASPVDQHETFVLTSEEVSQFSSAIFNALKEKFDPSSAKAGDVLSKFGEFSDDIDMIVLEPWRQFVELICGEVDGTTDPEGTAFSDLLSNIDAEPRLYSKLSNKLVIDNGLSDYDMLRPIIEHGQEAVEFEWHDWINKALESFQGHLDQIPSTLEEDLSRVEGALDDCQIHQDGIAMMKDGKAERARMKSLTRRKETAKNLMDEIEEMEAKLSSIESDLESITREEEQFKLETELVQVVGHLAEESEKIHSEANSSQKSYLSLKGIHSWSLGEMSDAEVNVTSLGTCTQTSFSASYHMGNRGEVEPKMLSQALTSSSDPRFRYHPSIASYLQASMRLLSSAVGRRNLRDSAEIGVHIQKNAWLVGRLDLTARELHILQRRYKAKIVRKSGDIFALRIVFKSDHAAVEVEFPLDPLYPAFPVEVQLDLVSGNVDFGDVRKSLIKQSKPGFGSLSRACDIVESFVKR